MNPLQLLTQVTLNRFCAVTQQGPGCQEGVNGTGTAISHEGKLYVMTCAHNVQDEDGAPCLGPVLFDHAEPILPRELEVAFLDTRLDLALLHIRQAARMKAPRVNPLCVQDLADMPRFRAARPGDGHGYAFIGSPNALKLSSEGRITFRCLAYRTDIKSTDGESRLVLAYQAPPGMEPLPLPHGISGCSVFECDLPVDGEIWTLGPAIAVEHARNTRTGDLICSPAAPIRDYLLRN